MLIGDLFDILPKSKHSASFGKASGKYPFFTSSNTLVSFVDDADYDGEYIVIGDGGSGNSKYINGKFSVSDHNYVLKPKSSTNAKAVNYFLKKDNYQILNAGFKGIGIKNVSKSYIEAIDYKFNHQFSENFIVESLDRINKAIRLSKDELESLKSLIKSRFNEMFGNCDLSQQKNIWVQLGEVTEILTGTTPSTANPENWNGDIFWITPAEIKEGDFVVYSTERKITEIGRKSKSLTIMPKGTVLLSTRAPIGKVAIAGNPMTCNQGFKNFVCGEKINNIYLYYLLRFNNDYLNSIGTGTTFKEISRSKISNVKIPTPPIELQNRFSFFVEQVDKLKFVYQMLPKFC